MFFISFVIRESLNAPQFAGALGCSRALFGDGGEFFERASGHGDSSDMELHS